jgi:Zn-dependent protease with chaperone function
LNALNSFNRTELSGVIAHEIGHIVNQDIKLNIQISAFVFGFTALFFLARFIFYNAIYNRRMDGRAKLVMFAMAAVIAIIGALTVWMGRILQAAMSRQREYLADASAVQFTRYPDGLVQAFKVLENGGKSTKMENPSSKEYAHAMMLTTLLMLVQIDFGKP